MNNDYQELIELIKGLYPIENHNSLIAQIQKYKRDYGYKYKGMYLTVKYYLEILEKPIQLEYGLGGIIPKYYEFAKKYHIRDKELSKQFILYSEKDEQYTIVKNKKSDGISTAILTDLKDL